MSSYADSLYLSRKREADEMNIVTDRALTNSDVEYFIKDFASCEGDAVMWLEDRGAFPVQFRGSNYLIDAEILRNISRSWVKNPMAVYEVAGVYFWRCMKELAANALAAVE